MRCATCQRGASSLPTQPSYHPLPSPALQPSAADELALQLGQSHVQLGINMPATAVPNDSVVSASTRGWLCGHVCCYACELATAVHNDSVVRGCAGPAPLLARSVCARVCLDAASFGAYLRPRLHATWCWASLCSCLTQLPHGMPSTSHRQAGDRDRNREES